MSEEKTKQPERLARSMMQQKEISLPDRDMINSIMRNQEISQEERFKLIIKMLEKMPDREAPEIEDEPVTIKSQETRKQIKIPHKSSRIPENLQIRDEAINFPVLNGPTETKLYLTEIYLKFKRYKFFRKRYLAERRNTFGLGINKRLIPTKKFMTVLDGIRSFQELILSKLPAILESILRDDSIESPLEFNYLRILRRWMIITPFSSVPYSRVKWLEQRGFEKELRPYCIYFYSFMAINREHRNNLLNLVENKLRLLPDLQKDEVLPEDDNGIISKKETANYHKEKFIYEYMGAIRSFIPVQGEADSLVAAYLKNRFNIFNLESLLNIALEAMVFHRPFNTSELKGYLTIKPLTVSSEIWDFNNDQLKLYGKDPDSLKKKRALRLKKELLWYDTLYQVVMLTDSGHNILIMAVNYMLEQTDKINRDAAEAKQSNFIIFLEAVVKYFQTLIVPLLDGSPLIFESLKDEKEGAIFSPDIFIEELSDINSLATEIHGFKNLNPTAKISEDEIKKIMTRKISSMNHVETLILRAGKSFYAIARKLHEIYHEHIIAIKNGKTQDKDAHAIENDDIGKGNFIPFETYSLKRFYKPNPFQQRLIGRRILSDTMKGGIYIFMMAYSYQASYICHYQQIKNDLDRRIYIKNLIRELVAKKDDSEV